MRGGVPRAGESGEKAVAMGGREWVKKGSLPTTQLQRRRRCRLGCPGRRGRHKAPPSSSPRAALAHAGAGASAWTNDRYHLGEVSLDGFTDLTRPDLRLKKEREAKPWPVPERTYVCVVCALDRATIRCMECENRVCGACVRREFSEHPNAESGPEDTTKHLATVSHHGGHHHGGGHRQSGRQSEHGGGVEPGGRPPVESQSFLLLHHIYCLKNGRPSRAFMRGLQQGRRKKSGSARKLKPLKKK